MQRIFIYGTLAPGRPNEHKLNDIEGSWQVATVKGRLKQKGWGAKLGYPGIVLDDENSEVEGFVFSSKELDKKWQMLDEFEGKEYKRVLIKAKLLSGEEVEAFIYALNQEK